jgi:uncharacterized membrane protein
MWMLMEGVVLYVVLVKVFIEKSKKNYLILFTVLSYGESELPAFSCQYTLGAVQVSLYCTWA